MAQDTGTDQPPPREPLDALLEHALLLDLEVSHEGKILRIGAALGHHVFDSVGNRSVSQPLETLAQWAANARCVLGHNLVRHDLLVLRERQPRHPLLRLPVIDTLVLSPIAFPENPYHRLVKNYKLVSESLNDPVADARLAATLFHDEFRSLAGLRQTEPALFDLLRFLLTTPHNERDTSARGLTLQPSSPRPPSAWPSPTPPPGSVSPAPTPSSHPGCSAILPTGGGKSLCFQLPGPGGATSCAAGIPCWLTVVLSPSRR
jgi:hypothetical protein